MPTADGTLQLLVVSDLHAFDGDPHDAAPSKLAMRGAASEATKIVTQIHEVLEKAGVDTVDYLLCAGDITNRADSGALARAWEMLHGLSSNLSAQLVATAGNHDYSSHEPEDEPETDDQPVEVDPKDALLQLTPPFPTGSDAERQRYFSYSFAIDDSGPALVVSYNSCTYHGLTHEKAAEYEHGRVTPHTVAKLVEALDAYASDQRPRVLVIHHHPIQLPNLDLKERSQIKDSGILLSALERSGPWLVVHGHKHRPWLHYSHGGGDAPTIMSASSLAANLGGAKFGSQLANQFHLIEIPDRPPDGIPSRLVGRVRSWSLDLLSDPVWFPAGMKQGLTANVGFGWRTSPTLLAEDLLSKLQAEEGTIGPETLREYEPRLDYLIPSDLDTLFATLCRAGNLEIERTATGDFLGVKFHEKGGVVDGP